MPKFKDIKSFPHCSYHVTVPWSYLEDKIATERLDTKIDLDPDFQRAHVWTEAQQIAYVEYILRGGTSGKSIYFNCVGWMDDFRGPYEIVDGKQRLEAVRSFMRGDIPAFGYKKFEYEDRLDTCVAYFDWNIAKLGTRVEVLEWYLAFNQGGTQHTRKELDKVQKLLEQERKNVKIS